MTGRGVFAVVVLIEAVVSLGCQSAPKRTVLPAPAGMNGTAARHHDEGIHANQQGQWESAKQHFEAAMAASPELAEAHYNLGLVLYRLGALREGGYAFHPGCELGAREQNHLGRSAVEECGGSRKRGCHAWC